MPELHSKQEVVKLSLSVAPPLATANMWSTTNFAPSCGVLPQYWQVKLSRIKTSKRNLTFEYGFLGNLVRFMVAILFPQAIASGLPFLTPPLITGIFARIKALVHDPKCFSYAAADGNFRCLLNNFISSLLGVLPNETNNSCSFDSKTSSSKGFRPLLFPRLDGISPEAVSALLHDPKYFSYELGPGNPSGLLAPFKSWYLGVRPINDDNSSNFFISCSFVNLGRCIGSIKKAYHKIIKKATIKFISLFDCLELAINH